LNAKEPYLACRHGETGRVRPDAKRPGLRLLIPLIAVLSITQTALGQFAPPSGFEAVELARSRACVGVLARLETLDLALEPLATRSLRLAAIAQAVALEERSIVDSLDTSDAVEAEVRAWFLTDGELAQRYLEEQTPALLAQRATGREAIKVTVSEASRAVQAEADEIIAATGTLRTDAGPCDGAIFVRSAVIEACQTPAGPVCEAALDTTGRASPFRFAESAEVLWYVEELRPWTDPGPLQVGPDGQLGGARTIGFTRTGNIVVSVAFSPLLRERADLTPEEIERANMINDSLGFELSHPDIVAVPSLGIRVTLPVPLSDESLYMLHFGTLDTADTLWTGPPGTGHPLEAAVELSPSHVGRLQAGEPITLTAIRASEAGEDEAVFTIELSSLNQARAVQALVGYMAQQLSSDLARLIRSGEF